MGIVDEKGVPTEGCKAFLANPKHADINKIAKIYEPRVITIPNENEVERYLPKQIKVLMWDGRLESKDVTWKDYDTNVGNDNFLGGELSSGEKVQVQIIIDTQASNMIRNGAFEEELCYWEVEASQGVKHEIRQEIAEEFPFEAKNYFYFSCKENLNLCIKQKVEHVEPGNYLFSLEYLGDNTTGVKVWMYVKGGDAEATADIFPTDSEWVKHELAFEVKCTGDVEIGIGVDFPAMYGKVREVKLVKEG